MLHIRDYRMSRLELGTVFVLQHYVIPVIQNARRLGMKIYVY